MVDRMGELMERGPPGAVTNCDEPGAEMPRAAPGQYEPDSSLLHRMWGSVRGGTWSEYDGQSTAEEAA